MVQHPLFVLAGKDTLEDEMTTVGKQMQRNHQPAGPSASKLLALHGHPVICTCLTPGSNNACSKLNAVSVTMTSSTCQDARTACCDNAVCLSLHMIVTSYALLGIHVTHPVPCCAVLCCAVLGCAVLCCAVLSHAALAVFLACCLKLAEEAMSKNTKTRAY